MVKSDVITLITENRTQNDFGVWETTTTENEVFCEVGSVSASEFFEAGRNGLNPEFRFVVFSGDYNDERTVIYKNRPYSIYRTYYRTDDGVELYAERKGGSNGNN